MKTILLAATLSLCCAVPAAAGSLEELTPYVSGQYFRWEEHQNNRRILKETGPLVSAGVVVGGSTNSSLTMRGRAEIFGAEVNYNGETQAPESVPARTEVNYFGIRNQFDLGHRFSSGSLRLEPFGGLGHRLWLRDIRSGTDATGQPFSGFTEFWQTGYGRLGARAAYPAPSGASFFAEAGALYPFYTGNTVDFVGSGTTTLHPRGKLSGFAETGITWNRLKLSLHYEGFRWSKSPVKAAGSELIFQPESRSDIFGLSLGWAFR